MTTRHIPTGIEALVCEDIARRQALGIQKYGKTVAENPLELRAWLQHAYEEMLDGAVYLRRAMEELRAQDEALERAHEAGFVEASRMHGPEIESLREDASHYRWLLKHRPTAILGVAYSVREACEHDDPHAALKAAIAATQQTTNPGQQAHS